LTRVLGGFHFLDSSFIPLFAEECYQSEDQWNEVEEKSGLDGLD